MSPEIIMFIVTQAIQQGPKVGRAVQALFEAKDKPSKTEWDTFFGSVEEKSYEDYTKPKPPFNPTLGD